MAARHDKPEGRGRNSTKATRVEKATMWGLGQGTRSPGRRSPGHRNLAEILEAEQANHHSLQFAYMGLENIGYVVAQKWFETISLETS